MSKKQEGKLNHKWRHGFAPQSGSHPFYIVWQNMLNRCRNPKNVSYPWYGAKGIKVCRRWHDFVNFHSDMFAGWERGLEIERKDFTKDYCPRNCCWVTGKEQMRNQSRNRWIEFNGRKQTITEWSYEIGGAHTLVGHRLRLGWTVEEAITTPPKKYNRTCGIFAKNAALVAARGL